MLRGPLDARGDALERNGEVLDQSVVTQYARQQVPKWFAAVRVGTGPSQRRDLSQGRAAEDVVPGQRAPHGFQSIDDVPAGRRREYRTVDGADAGANDQIGPHVGVDEGTKHADL